MPKDCPIIGIPARLDTSGLYPGRPIDAQGMSYSRAVLAAGGIPFLIPAQVTAPLAATLFERVDGLLFSGGGDVDPGCYQQSPQVDNLAGIQPERDQLEIALMQLAVERGKPFLAICRGHQVMNVATGGTLWQDLASQNPNTIRHDFYYSDDQLPRNYIAHYVRVDRDSRLYEILQTERVPVNSLHHQAVRQVSPQLTACGHAEDGVVEALEIPGHPFALGVQWHPEDLYRDQITARKLFAAFIQAAQNTP